MSLVIKMLKAPEAIEMTQSSISFGERGGSIGRGDSNDLVLADPERYLSSVHCQFICENGQYYLIDQSTNGTFYNGSMDPMGKGTRLPVKDQDEFIIGDYEFSIQLDASPVAFNDMDDKSLSSPFSDFSDDPFASSPDSGFDDYESNPFPSGQVYAKESLFVEQEGGVDPLAALDKASIAPSSPLADNSEDAYDPFASAAYSDGSDPMNQQVDWPSPVDEPSPPVVGGIPDDWDDELFSSGSNSLQQPLPPVDPSISIPKPAGRRQSAPRVPPAPTAEVESVSERQKTLEKVNAKIQAELNELKKQAAQASQRPAFSSTTVDTSFIEALGLNFEKLTDDEIYHINKLGGEVLREMVSGLMKVLGSRSAIKNEFRMNVTTIQPVENNPLKFSANTDDALENMFIKKGNAFKKPVDAVDEGFKGVAEHQLAVLAGIREAFTSLLERFNPEHLEERFNQQAKGGLLPGSQKARKWDAYIAYYNEMAGDIDSSFHYLFGDKFVRAYEEQLHKLSISRKAKKFTNEN
jgi:type VI secretion system protein